MTSRPAAFLGVIALTLVSCTPSETVSSAERVQVTTTVAPTTTTELPDDVGPVAPPVRHPVSLESIYFVMPDRFANGDTSNDT